MAHREMRQRPSAENGNHIMSKQREMKTKGKRVISRTTSMSFFAAAITVYHIYQAKKIENVGKIGAAGSCRGRQALEPVRYYWYAGEAIACCLSRGNIIKKAWRGRQSKS